jgi:hypothetical protein
MAKVYKMNNYKYYNNIKNNELLIMYTWNTFFIPQSLLLYNKLNYKFEIDYEI